MNEYVATIDNVQKSVKVFEENFVSVNGKKIYFDIVELGDYSYSLRLNNKFYEVVSYQLNNEIYAVLVDGNYSEVTVRTALQEKANKLLSQKTQKQHHAEIKSPMPGMVIKIKKKRGENVEMGESLLILEAMKMENDIKSPATGKIKEIYVSEGIPVEKGVLLISIE